MDECDTKVPRIVHGTSMGKNILLHARDAENRCISMILSRFIVIR